MSTELLGKALTEARIARGLTLRDVERDTRISLKYLQALEDGQIEELPAPVYARAFTRTYAQYLGLNAAPLVQRLPGARPETEPEHSLPPFPSVNREVMVPLLSANWLVVGVVVAILFAVGLVLFWNRGGEGTETVTSNPPVGEEPAEGAEQPTLPPDQPPPTIVVEPGIVPDVEGVNALLAIDAVNRAGLPYMIIEVEDEDAQAGVVLQQSPSPETEADENTVVTLVIGRSP
ncbi:MAG: helix-turn-helix domain-containing protein [Dehalococcoidia bacterium]